LKKLSVPYTIKRNGVYYLNLRWKNQFIRQSLATKDPMEAFKKVNQLAPLIVNTSACVKTLRLQVSEIVGSGPHQKGKPLKLTEPDGSMLLLSHAFTLYKKEQVIENWGVRTAAQNEATLRQLIEIIGDMPVVAVTKTVVRQYKQILLSYPANRYKGKCKDKTLDQLVKEQCTPIGLETVRNIMGRVSSFFNWLVNQGYAEENPFLGVAPKRVHSARSERSSFTDSDLKLIFGTPLYKDKIYDHNWQYWLPLLGLYTGARMEELCQLKGRDFRVSGDTHYIDINGEGDTQNRVKTPSSIRKIPLHSELISLGVLGLVQDHPKDRFLFDLKRINTNLGHVPSRWFGRYKASLGFPKGTKVFHSFRHTLRDHMTLSGVPNEHIREILGHEQVGETFGRYGSSIPVSILAQSIEKLSFCLPYTGKSNVSLKFK
jgi:integrase